MSKRAFGIAIAAVGVAIAIYGKVGNLDAGPPRGAKTTALPLVSVPLTLADGSTAGKSVTLANFRGRPLALVLGYSSCPDVCPLALGYLKKELASAPSLQVAFISVDPRDTPADVARFAGKFDSRFIALSGKQDDLKRLASGLGAYSGSGSEGAPLAHSSAIFFLDAQLSALDVVSAPYLSGAVAERASRQAPARL